MAGERDLSPSSRRAWIEITNCCLIVRRRGSPSSRRAWIEISSNVSANRVICVALLAEGVDRNMVGLSAFWQETLSPSSRRAWIEITPARLKRARPWVALLAEGVDRNSRRM